MSYSKFEYSYLHLPEEATTHDSIDVSIQVRNAGTRDGDEVVQLYIKNLTADGSTPLQSLQGLQRIHLHAGETKLVHFTLQPKQFAVIDSQHQCVVEPNKFAVSIGGGIPGQTAVTTGSVTKQIRLLGGPFLTH